MTSKYLRFCKIFVRRVLTQDFRAVIWIKITENLPRSGREFSGNFMKNSVVGFSLDFHFNGLYFILYSTDFPRDFQELSDNIPNIL